MEVSLTASNPDKVSNDLLANNSEVNLACDDMGYPPFLIYPLCMQFSPLKWQSLDFYLLIAKADQISEADQIHLFPILWPMTHSEFLVEKCNRGVL